MSLVETHAGVIGAARPLCDPFSTPETMGTNRLSTSALLRALCFVAISSLAGCTVSHITWYHIPGTGRDDPATLFNDSTGRCTLNVVLQADVPAAVLWFDARDSIRILDVTADLCPVTADSARANCLSPMQAHATMWFPGRGLRMEHADSFPGLPAGFRVVRNGGKQRSALRLEFYSPPEPPERPVRGATAKASGWRGAEVYTLWIRMVLEAGGRMRTVERTYRVERREETNVRMDRIGGC